MKFIEVAPGLSINIERIDAVQRYFDEKGQEDGTVLYVNEENYHVKIPYQTFVKLMIRQKNIQDTLTRSVEQLAKYQGTPTP